MTLTKTNYIWLLGSAIALALVVDVSLNYFTWNGLIDILAEDIDASGPGWMIVIGLGLFGVRALISKPDKAKL